MENVPEDFKVEYSPINHFYRGEAEGGPNNGQMMTHVTLTKFIPRNVVNKTPFISPGAQMSMSEEELNAFQKAQKDALVESTWAKNNPHRYDFDLDRNVWVYKPYPESSDDKSIYKEK